MGKKVVLDSNVFVALYKADDSNHLKAKELTTKLHQEGVVFVASSLVVQETATVISMKVGQEEAKEFYEKKERVIDQEIHFDEKLEKAAWNIFLTQKKKGTSFIDCSNLALMEVYKFDGILSFDTFYPKNVRIS